MFGYKDGTMSMVPRCETWAPISMLGDMERLFSGSCCAAVNPFEATLPTGENFRMPMVDMKDEKDRYLVQAEMPGMTKENVSIEMDGDLLKISAFREKSSEHDDDGYLTRERGSMRFHRQVMLPQNIDHDAIKARMENGVLEIILPKVVPVEAKNKIQVE